MPTFTHNKMSRSTTKPTKWPVHQAKTQISLGIRPVWSGSSLSAWRNIGSLATHWAHTEDSHQTGRMPRLIWVVAGRTCHPVVFVTRRLKYTKVIIHSYNDSNMCYLLAGRPYCHLRLEDNVLQNGSKGGHTDTPAYQHSNLISEPVLVTFTKRTVQVQLKREWYFIKTYSRWSVHLDIYVFKFYRYGILTYLFQKKHCFKRNTVTIGAKQQYLIYEY